MHTTFVRTARALPLSLALLMLMATAAQAAPIKWTRQFGTTGLDHTTDVIVAPDGSVLITGSLDFYATADDDATVLRRYSPAGALLWERRVATAGDDSGMALAVDSSYVYLAARGTLPSAPDGHLNYVRRYSLAAGSLGWTETWDYFDDGEAMDLALEGSTLYALLGGSNSAVIKLDPSTGTEQGRFDGYDADALDVQDGSIYVATDDLHFVGGTLRDSLHLMKLQQSGALIWEAWVDAANDRGSLLVEAVSADAQGVAVGLEADRAFGGFENRGSFDGYVAAFTHGGGGRWVRRIATPETDLVLDVVADGSRVFAGGHTGGRLPGQTRRGSADAFVRAFDSAGAVLWTHQFGTSSAEFGEGIAVGGNTVFLGGATDGNLAGRVGERDIYLAKFNKSGR